MSDSLRNSKEKALVSIIVPVYNAEKYLTECIESILKQDYHNIELILVNDGSSDRSLDICRKYEGDNIVVIDKRNEGVSIARNIGLSRAQGFYVGFVDSDDRIPNNAISTLVSAIEKDCGDYVVGQFSYDYDGKLISHNLRLQSGKYQRDELLTKFIDDGTLSGFLLGSACCGLYKKNILDNFHIVFNSKIKLNEDGLFNFEYVLRANTICVINEVVYYYRQYNESSSKRTEFADTNEIIYNYLLNYDWDREQYCYEEQMKARNVSIALWDLLRISRDDTLSDNIRYIRNRISKIEVREGIHYLNYEGMNFYKKTIAWLIHYQHSVMLCLLIRFIIPIANKHLKR